MALRTIPGTDQDYHLVSFDEKGKECPTKDGLLQTEAIVAQLHDRTTPITDVFFVAHGWKGDVPAAKKQFDNWLGAMHSVPEGRVRAEARAGGFRPLIIGLHWPSQPWGDERVSSTGPRGQLLGDVGDAVDLFANLIADTLAARGALETVLAAPKQYGDCQELPSQVREAYETLYRESGLVDDADLADLDDDQSSPWNADESFRGALAADSNEHTLGGGASDLLLAPLRQLSFWKMKKRARTFGESGAAELLARLMGVAATAVRFHLMGHSFGCIVVSASVQAASAKPGGRSVESLLLVQGALSLWAFAESVPGESASKDKGKAGYFNSIIRNELVSGPMVATLSMHDTAVGRYYPIGARLGKQSTLAADLPKYGGIGAFGVQGVGASAITLLPGNMSKPYGLARRKIYNVESSDVIANGDGASGAHNDISHPELAYLAWELVTASA